MKEIPSYFKPTYSRDEIARKVRELGESITPWASTVYKETGKDLLTIPVLRGGIFFFADLVREIKTSVEVVPIQSWAYDHNAVIRSKVEYRIEDVAAKDKSLLLVDDICDSGKTLRALTQAFLELGAKEVKTAVLIRRQLDTETFKPDWVGFQYKGPEWFVGYGMDDNDSWKNLGDIYIIDKAIT